MAQEITTYDEVSTIDKDTKLLLTKDGGLGQKSIEEVGNVINGIGDISGIGDGTVKGAIRGLNDELTVIGKCKNLLNPTLQTNTQNGVTCTNNGDGTYTLNGTASADTTFILKNTANIVEENANKTIRFVAKGDTLETYYTQIYFNNTTPAKDLGSGISFKVPINVSETNMAVLIKSSAVLSNILIKPMITTNLDATYDDFVPYTGDGNTLTADVAKINDDLSDLIARVTALENK